MKTINVLIAEDHSLTAKLLARMLSKKKNINVVATAADGNEVLSIIRDQLVDIILMDLSMPFLDGIQTMELLFKENYNIKVIILSGHTEGKLIQKSVKTGASGYLTKTVDMNEIIEALVTVYEGGTYFDEISLETIQKSENINNDISDNISK
jgi:two-component system, NarL family, nitrate/nitrite response regulator NarL